MQNIENNNDTFFRAEVNKSGNFCIENIIYKVINFELYSSVTVW